MFASVMALSVLIGISLGLLGGGGSILTIPILKYVAGMSAAAAIASSLVVVGATSLVGAVTHARAGRVRWRTGLLFGTAGMAGAFGGGRIGTLLPGKLLMVMFGVMMAVTAIAMLRGRRALAPTGVEPPLVRTLALGAVFGLITGLLGAGGGFLVVPALVLFGGLSMPSAVGTSLLVIALNSFAGLLGHLGQVAIDWPLTLLVTGVAIAGSLVGSRFAGRLPPETLRRAFGVFVIVMAVFVLLKELVL